MTSGKQGQHLVWCGVVCEVRWGGVRWGGVGWSGVLLLCFLSFLQTLEEIPKGSHAHMKLNFNTL